MSQELCGLLRQAQSDPSSSQLAALLQQHSHLKQSTDTVSAPAMSACNNQLETFEVGRRAQTCNHILLFGLPGSKPTPVRVAFSVMHQDVCTRYGAEEELSLLESKLIQCRPMCRLQWGYIQSMCVCVGGGG